MGCIFQSAWSSTETKNQKRIKLLYIFLLDGLKKKKAENKKMCFLKRKNKLQGAITIV